MAIWTDVPPPTASTWVNVFYIEAYAIERVTGGETNVSLGQDPLNIFVSEKVSMRDTNSNGVDPLLISNTERISGKDSKTSTIT